MDFVVRPADRALFKGCRRAWDYGARTRQNLEPLDSPAAPNLDEAVHDALAVYYFPGMWDWSPAIVLPIVRQAYEKSMARQRTAAAPPRRASEAWDLATEVGRELLENYFQWAPAIDRFAPMRIATDVDVHVPDPDQAGTDLVTPDGWPVRLTDRIDLLVIDEYDRYWMIRHHLVSGPHDDLELLSLDEQALGWCWAWELAYPGMRIAGTIYNDLRLGATSAGHAPAGSARSPVSQHRRMYVQPIGADAPGPVTRTGSTRRKPTASATSGSPAPAPNWPITASGWRGRPARCSPRSRRSCRTRARGPAPPARTASRASPPTRDAPSRRSSTATTGGGPPNGSRRVAWAE
jgi:hypothetical protein